eukprot:m.174417 g.174417  ORF g.174417 m.174417 type:complete len:252 (+) comp16751_c0_seq28:2267-3022(+)
MENELCRTACSANNLGPLRVNDQLTRERAEERVFASFSEAHIDFLPTYKYDMLTDDYDTSDKQRVPAWTDRVLFRGDVTCTTYQRIDTLRISDHRPVFALLTFNVIDVNRDAEVKVRETILGDLRRELATVVVYCLGDAALAVQDVQAVFEVFGSVVIVDQQLADSATLVTFETIEAAEKAIRAEHVEVDGMPVKVSCFQLKSCFAAPCMKADVPYEHALLVCVSTACCRVLSIEAGASRASSHSPVSTSR